MNSIIAVIAAGVPCYCLLSILMNKPDDLRKELLVPYGYFICTNMYIGNIIGSTNLADNVLHNVQPAVALHIHTHRPGKGGAMARHINFRHQGNKTVPAISYQLLHFGDGIIFPLIT